MSYKAILYEMNALNIRILVKTELKGFPIETHRTKT